MRSRAALALSLVATLVVTMALAGGAEAAGKRFAGKVAAQSNSGVVMRVAIRRKVPKRVLDFRWANVLFDCDGIQRNIIGASRDFNPDIRVKKPRQKGQPRRFTFVDAGIDHLMEVSGTFKGRGASMRIKGLLHIVDTFDGTMCTSGVVSFTAKPGTISPPPG